MATWTVSPSDGVTGTGPSFTFPANTGTTDKVYTITYTDDNGCIASTTCTIPYGQECRQTCDCSNLHVTETSLVFDSNGGDKIIGTVDAGCTIYVLGSTNWATIRQDGNNVIASAIANDSANEKRAGLSIAITVDGNPCVSPVMFVQSGKTTTYNITVRPQVTDTLVSCTVEATYDSDSPIPFYITGANANLSFIKCDGNEGGEEGIPLPVTYSKCGQIGQPGQIYGQLTIDSFACTVTINATSYNMSTNNVPGYPSTLTITEGNITYNVACTT